MEQSTAIAPGVDDPAVPSPWFLAPVGLTDQNWPPGSVGPTVRTGPVGPDGPNPEAGSTESPAGPAAANALATTTRRLRVVLGSVVVAVVAASVVAGLLASSAWSARRQAHAADTATAATRARVASTDHRLEEIEAELKAVRARWGTAETALEAANRSLAALRFELAGTQNHQFDQGVSIGAVQSCLGGVQAALNDIALGFPGQATAALHNVAGSCATAGVSEG